MAKAKRKKQDDQWKFLDGVKKPEAKAAIKTLNESLELFGPKGQYWIQADEHGEDEDGNDTFCAIGAISHADGPGEELALIAVGAAMDVITYEEDADILQEVIDSINVRTFDTPEAIKEYIDEEYARRLNDISQLSENARDNIPSFNDRNSTRFADIKRCFSLAIKKLQTV